jgi:hypothetical protein
VKSDPLTIGSASASLQRHEALQLLVEVLDDDHLLRSKPQRHPISSPFARRKHRLPILNDRDRRHKRFVAVDEHQKPPVARHCILRPRLKTG